MRILFVSQRFVLPMDTGGKIRTGKILEQLNRLHHLTLVSNVDAPRDAPMVARVKDLCAVFVAVPWSETRRHTLRFFARLAFQNLSRHPVSVLNTYSRRLRGEVERLCATGEFDVAICDFVQCGLLFARVRSLPIIVFQHNVEAEIARRHVEQSRNPMARFFWWLQWRKMARYEREYCRRFDHVIAVSEHDRRLFEQLYGVTRCTSIPTGVDTTYYTPTPAPARGGNTIVFCGSMDWLPNEDGVLWFIREILPTVRERVASIRFLVVGRAPSTVVRRVAAHCEEVELTGWVEDTRPHLARADVFVVPLRIGGGTRMKIFEAMACGRAVVSTAIGAEGLPVSHGMNCFIEDAPAAFADRLVALLRDSAERGRVGDAARRYVVENASWIKVVTDFAAICERAVTERDGSHAGAKPV